MKPFYPIRAELLLEPNHDLEQLAAQALKPDMEARRIPVRWYSGAAVDRFDWWREEFYKLRLSLDPSHVDLSRLSAGAPVLNAHSQWSAESVLGAVETPWIANGEAFAWLRFVKGDEAVNKVWNKIEQGVLRHVSVGTFISETQDETPKGAKLRQVVATAWQPYEISVVPVPADQRAGMLAALSAIVPSIAEPSTKQNLSGLDLAVALNRNAIDLNR